jgi:hypothetical protein
MLIYFSSLHQPTFAQVREWSKEFYLQQTCDGWAIDITKGPGSSTNDKLKTLK